ncbi:MAG: hypothetical protein J4F28_09280, partial [Nitrosopumilaceae archaeon]|nr:hypothetical protein [Nitrosopumilaceae archaeon]
MYGGIISTSISSSGGLGFGGTSGSRILHAFGIRDTAVIVLDWLLRLPAPLRFPVLVLILVRILVLVLVRTRRRFPGFLIPGVPWVSTAATGAPIDQPLVGGSNIPPVPRVPGLHTAVPHTAAGR